MKYLLIKDYKRSLNEGAEKILKAGTFIDVGSDKAESLRKSGHIEKDAEPKPYKKPRKSKPWIETDDEDELTINN